MTIRLTVRAALVAGLLALQGTAAAADLRDVEVERDDDRYTLRSVAWFDADRESLYDVLTNYELFRFFTSAIVESRNLDPDHLGRPRFFTRMEGCVIFFCKSFVRIGHLELLENAEIIAVSNPEQSDFLKSRERWRLVPADGGTMMIYEFEMVPDFWVPPVIGPYLIQRALRSGGGDAIDRIEALAIAEHAR